MVWVGWCDVVRPSSRAEADSEARPIWARGGKARRGGVEVHPTGRTEPSPHQAILATDGGASRGGEASWRSVVAPAST